MTMYKIINDYQIRKGNSFIPRDPENMDYLQFEKDVVGIGTTCVEGADVETQISYVDARVAEYPPLQEQLDKIYHSGVDAWKADIKAIKDKYPKTQVAITTVASIPDWVNTALFDRQKEKYVEAKARLARYELANGVKDENGDYTIEPLPLIVGNERNPLVVADEAERNAAQEVIIDTPQAVIDSINT